MATGDIPPDVELSRPEYVTAFAERETGAPMYRSGRWLGSVEYEEGMRPYPDRVSVYDPVEVVPVDGDKPADEAVFDAAAEVDDGREWRRYNNPVVSEGVFRVGGVGTPRRQGQPRVLEGRGYRQRRR